MVSELDGAVWRQGIAAYRILPYVSRQQVEELNWLEDDEEDLEEGEDWEQLLAEEEENAESEEEEIEESEDEAS